MTIGDEIKTIFERLYRNVDGLSIKRKVDPETGDIRENKKMGI